MTTPALVAVCVLVMATPFETRYPIFTLPWQQVTVTEAVWLGVAVVWVWTHVRARQWPAWRSPVTIPWLVWIGVMAVAAVAADADRANAMKVTGRFVVGGLTAWIVATSVRTSRDMTILLAVAAGTGAVVALLAVLEVWQLPAVLGSLGAFREGLRLVGGEVRASSTLQYPTIAAMYFELVLCGSLGVWLWMGQHRRWRMAWVGMLVVAVLAIGLALTLTRAAVLASLVGLLVAAWGRYRRVGVDGGAALLATSALLLLCAPLVASSSETARARWTTEGREGWYRAAFEAPTAITSRPGAVVVVPVTVVNIGRITWSPDATPPFALSYHVVDAASTRVIHFDGIRTALPGDVAPGARVTVPVRVRVPREAGDYRVAWDVVLEHRLWFVTEPGAVTTFTPVRVAGALVAGAPPTPSQMRRSPYALPTPVHVPGRLELWRAALRMAADHPWTGVGPDNFRWRYGAYLGDAEVDTRVHSNNQYLEVLTGGGVFAAAAFGWFLWRLVGVAGRIRARLAGPAAAAYTGVVAAGVAFLAHGVLDSFLTFTPTAFASALVLGLAVAPVWWTEGA